MYDKKTLDEIDEKLTQLKEEKRLRLIQKKKRELRQKAIADSSFRGVENQIKYMLGGMVLSIWGKKKSLETLEKSPSLTDYQKSVIEKYKDHYKEELSAEAKLEEKNKNA